MQAVRAEARATVIADQVVSRLRRRVVIPMLLAAAAAVVFVGIYVLQDAEETPVTPQAGICSVIHADGDVSMLRDGQLGPPPADGQLQSGDWIVVGSGRATVQFADRRGMKILHMDRRLMLPGQYQVQQDAGHRSQADAAHAEITDAEHHAADANDQHQ